MFYTFILNLDGSKVLGISPLKLRKVTIQSKKELKHSTPYLPLLQYFQGSNECWKWKCDLFRVMQNNPLFPEGRWLGGEIQQPNVFILKSFLFRTGKWLSEIYHLLTRGNRLWNNRVRADRTAPRTTVVKSDRSHPSATCLKWPL